MSEGLAGQLLVLALVDSTSIGTLVIPVLMLLLSGGPRFDRYGFYLGIVAGIYFAVGLALALGAGAVVDVVGDRISSQTQAVIQLCFGVGLLAASYWLYRRHKQHQEEGLAPDWGARVARGLSSRRNLTLLAFGAVAAELATMVPYLAAIGLITQADLSFPTKTVTLACYAFVMVLPALTLFVAHGLLKSAIDPYLRRFGDWLVRTSFDNLSWVAGIIGFYLAANAIGKLFGG